MTPQRTLSAVSGHHSGRAGHPRHDGPESATRCAAADGCRGADTAGPAWVDSGPLCRQCLDVAMRDVRALIYDYLDLEQLLPVQSGSRLEWVSGSRDPSVPLALGAEALQAEILHTLTLWDEVVRDFCGLSAPKIGRVRGGWAVQRAAETIAPRVGKLARVEAWPVLLDGMDGPLTDVSGVEAVLSFTALHRRARAALQLTRKIEAMAGYCWLRTVTYGDGCGMPTLRRESGSETVYCEHCGGRATWDDYRRQLGMVPTPTIKGRRDDMAVPG